MDKIGLNLADFLRGNRGHLDGLYVSPDVSIDEYVSGGGSRDGSHGLIVRLISMRACLRYENPKLCGAVIDSLVPVSSISTSSNAVVVVFHALYATGGCFSTRSVAPAVLPVVIPSVPELNQ